MPPPDTWLTQDPQSAHAARPQRAQNTVEDPTALPERACIKWSPHGVLCDGTALSSHSQRTYSVAGDCTACTSAICTFWTLWERCKYATLVWQGFYIFQTISLRFQIVVTLILRTRFQSGYSKKVPIGLIGQFSLYIWRYIIQRGVAYTFWRS